MDAPTPISIETNESEIYKKNEKSNIIKKKGYELKINNNKFKLNITIDNKFINFKLYQINNIILFYYKNQFDLNDIVNKLDISHKLYNDLEKVMVI